MTTEILTLLLFSYSVILA